MADSRRLRTNNAYFENLSKNTRQNKTRTELEKYLLKQHYTIAQVTLHDNNSNNKSHTIRHKKSVALYTSLQDNNNNKVTPQTRHATDWNVDASRSGKTSTLSSTCCSPSRSCRSYREEHFSKPSNNKDR